MPETCGIYLYQVSRKKFLTCHATNARFDSWSIPKGLRDKDEDCFTAACRELFEETGISIEKVNILHKQQLPVRSYKKQKKVLYSWLIITDTIINDNELQCSSLIKGGQPEIDKYGWATFPQAEKLLHETQVENLELIREIISGKEF